MADFLLLSPIWRLLTNYGACTMIRAMTTFWQEWGKELLRLREAKGMSRRELEDRSGVSQRHIEYLENGEKQPGTKVLGALASELGPELLQAAFPEVAILPRRGTRFRDLATGRYGGRPDHPTPERTYDVALA